MTTAGATGAAPLVLDFDGLGAPQGGGVYEAVGDFYDGGTGDGGSEPDVDFGVEFSDDAPAIKNADAVGLLERVGNFGGEPSPDTVLFFPQGTEATMTFREDFADGFSFYSAINFLRGIAVHSGPEATGDVLTTLGLPLLLGGLLGLGLLGRGGTTAAEAHRRSA